MRTLLAATAAAAMMVGTAMADDAAAPATNGPNNPAINTDGGNNSMTPVAGANSFTMDEARSRIESRGYTHVRNLKKDGNGIWRGKATKDGHAGPVSLDFQGNVN